MLLIVLLYSSITTCNLIKLKAGNIRRKKYMGFNNHRNKDLCNGPLSDWTNVRPNTQDANPPDDDVSFAYELTHLHLSLSSAD